MNSIRIQIHERDRMKILYAQTEKEYLGLVFGLEEFHSYIYGLPTFTVETDNHLLIAIMKKTLNEMSLIMQLMMMKLLQFLYRTQIPGKSLKKLLELGP